MKNSIAVNRICRGLLGFVFVLLMVLAIGPVAALAQNITVMGSPIVGVLPQMITAFAHPANDVLPSGANDWYVFTLFDTGSTRVAFDSGTAATLGVSTGLFADVRINGLGAIDAVTLYAPIYPDQVGYVPQAEVLNIFLSVPTSSPVNRTLIGGPVTNVVKAVIDYTTTVTRGPYTSLNPQYYDGPDIAFYPIGGDVGYVPVITLSLDPFGTINSVAGLGQRYYMHNVSFNNGSISIASPASGEIDQFTSSTRFLYDTGTSVTLITTDLATALGLTGTPDFTQPMSDGSTLDGYSLNSITMTGAGGTYTVDGAPVLVTTSTLGGAADAIIGSNLFSQAKLLFNGPAATLGISVPGANNPPVADAGADRVIEATGPTTPFMLDGTLSSDPDGDTLTYSWVEANGNVVGTEATVMLSQGLGTYLFMLTVTDAGGLTAQDTVSITIVDTTPPVLAAPPDITVPESDPMGTAVNLGQPTVSDNYDTVFTVSNNAPALFPLGDTTVTWTVSDSSGNTSSAQQKVTVEPGTPLNQLRNLVKLINYSVASGGVAPEMQTSLLAKINAAIAALVQGNANASKVAMNDLKALVNQVEAQTDKKITPAVAAEIIVRANRIIAALGG
jgi:hypothetical protein